MNKLIATKFVDWDVDPLYTLRNEKAYILRVKVNNGFKLTRDEKDWIVRNLNGNYKDSILVRGWRFRFTDILKTYVVKRYDSWQEYKSIDKTALRNVLYGTIQKIVLVK